KVVDTQVAGALVRAAQAARMLGAQVVLTGISPEIAQTLVHIGAELRDMTTRATLQEGIDYALKRRAADPHLTGNDRRTGPR
ncbi:MAG: STAS domain-containing protein, partial [Chloroflexus sp.]|nr:STAS domain-containing protein [Chloroflexus sp.]